MANYRITDEQLADLAAKALKISAEDIEITDPAKGYILRSPDNSRWRITISNAGVLTPVKL